MATQVNRFDTEVEIIKEPSRDAKRTLYYLAALFILAGITFFLGLGRLPFVGPDEPRYAEVAREMFATGDYISPRLAGCVWFEKPALTYWLAAAAYHAFGVNEFAARLPAALLALATALLVYYSISRTLSSRLGFVVGVVLVTSGIFLGLARAISTDMPLTASMSFALLSGYLFTQSSGRARTGYWILCWASMGLAMLAKGLVGIMLVLAILGIYVLVTGQLKTIGWHYLPLGFAALIIVAAIWYLPVTLANGWEFINEFFIEHHFHRYLTNRYSHPQPFYFYLLISLIGVLPWTFFLIPAVARIRRLRPRSNNLDRLLTLAWIWMAVPVVFFSFSVSKLPGYILPVFPALAIIIGAEVERFLSTERMLLHKIAAWLTAFELVILSAAFIVFAEREAVTPAGWKILFLWLPAMLASVALVLLVARKRQAFISAAASVIAAAIIVIVVLGFPVLGERLSLKRLSLEAAAALRPDEKTTFFVMKEFAPLFYTEGRVVCGIGGNHVLNAMSEAQLVEALTGEKSLVVFTKAEWLSSLEKSRILAVEHIGRQGSAVAVRVTFKEPAISSK